MHQEGGPFGVFSGLLKAAALFATMGGALMIGILLDMEKHPEFWFNTLWPSVAVFFATWLLRKR